MQATITELQQQLEVQMQENMAPPHMDLGFLDDGLLEPQPSGAQEQSTALAVPRSPRQAEVPSLTICNFCAACYQEFAAAPS